MAAFDCIIVSYSLCPQMCINPFYAECIFPSLSTVMSPFPNLGLLVIFFIFIQILRHFCKQTVENLTNVPQSGL